MESTTSHTWRIAGSFSGAALDLRFFFFFGAGVVVVAGGGVEVWLALPFAADELPDPDAVEGAAIGAPAETVGGAAAAVVATPAGA